MQAKGVGRVPARVRERIRKFILSGAVPPGSLLPGLRRMSREHKAALTTVHQALTTLVAEGLIAAEPRRGYRVLYGADDDERTRPVAYVTSQRGGPGEWEPFFQELLVAFQDAAHSRGWTMLGVGAADQDHAAVMRQLAGARSWGVLLERANPELVAMVRASGLPAIIVRPGAEDAGLDAVMQDNYQGGMLAAEHLLARGHRRIAWVGATVRTGYSLARLAGASAALLRAGAELAPELRVETSGDNARERARELLRRPERPTAILALWREEAIDVAAAARELGLVAGSDFDMVGWCVEEQYERGYRPAFAGGPVPPTVVWSARAMANLAVSRLAERRANPGLEAVRIHVPVTLRVAD
jgi:DNA-binding LacI/PurR family transcriptional regulator